MLSSTAAMAQDELDTEEAGEVNAGCTDLFPGMDESLVEKPAESIFTFLDAPTHTVAKRFGGMTRSLDTYFTNESATYPTSGSFIRYTVDTTFSEGGNQTTTGHLKIRAKLPLLEKKLRVVLESNPEEQRSEIERVRDTPASPANPDDESTQKPTAGKWNFKPHLGIRIRSPVDWYIRYKGTREFPLADPWKLYLGQSVYWFDSSGFGADTNIDFERLITDDVLFRAGTLLRYTDLNDYWDLGETFTLSHRLSERRIISYQIGAYGINEPKTHVTDYLALVRYRQDLHKNYLFAEIAPQIHYQRINNFEAEHSILFRIELFFRD